MCFFCLNTLTNLKQKYYFCRASPIFVEVKQQQAWLLLFLLSKNKRRAIIVTCKQTKGFFKGNHDWELFPVPFSGGYNGDKFVRLINKHLPPFSKDNNLVLKSHSFRVNFVTSLLKSSKVQYVQQITGHQDVRSIMAYSRHRLSVQEQDDVLEQAFK